MSKETFVCTGNILTTLLANGLSRKTCLQLSKFVWAAAKECYPSIPNRRGRISISKFVRVWWNSTVMIGHWILSIILDWVRSIWFADHRFAHRTSVCLSLNNQIIRLLYDLNKENKAVLESIQNRCILNGQWHPPEEAYPNVFDTQDVDRITDERRRAGYINA